MSEPTISPRFVDETTFQRQVSAPESKTSSGPGTIQFWSLALDLVLQYCMTGCWIMSVEYELIMKDEDKIGDNNS